MRPIATGVACSIVYVSVCLLGTRMSCAKWLTNRHAVWRLTHVGPRYHVLDGLNIPHGGGQFWGLSSQLKSIGSLMQCVQQKGSFGPQQQLTARLLQLTAILPTGWDHIILSTVKNSPPVMWPFVKILWRLVLISISALNAHQWINTIDWLTGIASSLLKPGPIILKFIPCDTMLAQYMPLLCVCLSVYPVKWLNISSFK